MNHAEHCYRKIMGSIGLSMLLFLGLINLFSIFLVFLNGVVFALELFDVTVTVIVEISYAVGYLLSFMLPVVLLRTLIKRSPYPYYPTKTTLRISPWSLLCIPAGILIIFSASYINQSFLGFFGTSTLPSLTTTFIENQLHLAPFEIVIIFIVNCVVPGFCEELLFRGAILSNCMPFGRQTAILISSFFFALMHQTPDQIFYTFVAGIVLGVIYVYTNSIWPCTIVHILNNFFATLQEFITERYDYRVEGFAWSLMLETILFIVGIVALLVLVVRFFSGKRVASEGFFQKDLSLSDGFAAVSISPNKAIKLFLTPSVLIFIILSVLQILILLISMVIYGSFA